MVFSPYMPTTGGGGGQCSTLLIHRSNTKHTKSSAQVMIDVESLDDSFGQIWAQQHLMDHMDPDSPHQSVQEKRVVCASNHFFGFWCDDKITPT